MRRTAYVAIALLGVSFLSTTFAQDGEKIAIKLDRRIKQGERLKVSEETLEERKFVQKEPGKPEQVDEGSEKKTLEYERDVIAMEKDTVVSKETRTFSKFKIAQSAGGTKGEEDGSLEGKKVTFVRGMAGNEFQLENGVSPGAFALDYLNTEKEREVEQHLADNPWLPPAKLAKGETWTFDIKKLTNALKGASMFEGARYDLVDSKGTGKLVSVEQKGGAPYGKFEIDITLKLAGFGPAVVTGGKGLTMKGTFEACLDGSRPDMAIDIEDHLDCTVEDEGTAGGKQQITYTIRHKVKRRVELLGK